MKDVESFLDFIDRFQRVLTSIFFFITLVVVSFQVFNRFLFHLPVMWTTDVSVFCFIWLALLSASSSVRSNGHFRVTALIDASRLQGSPRFAFEVVSMAAVALLSMILIVFGLDFTIAGAREQSPGLAFPMAWSYAAIPLCSATALLFALEQLWRLKRGGQMGVPELDVQKDL